MKKNFLIVLAFSFIALACGDKKAEEEKKKAVELEQKIEAVDKEVDQDVESLQKEADEIENELKALDNL
ncbi:hypothetical protein [uncultured Tenacibaculum sp.]|uniref:hypothetical protein n=1 Tax=uncultured Tenacibaculum sp. TaxID=174713 RepID=UPI002603E383|nr:hypothetical protein [uncultured Tenacibaculum sp.]